MTGEIGEGRRAQAPSGTELRDGFEKVRLARAIRAKEADMPPIEIQRDSLVIAEIGEAEAREGGHVLSSSPVHGGGARRAEGGAAGVEL